MIATSRRGLLGMFAAGAAAAIVRTPGLLMPIKADRLTIREIVERAYERISNPPVMLAWRMLGEMPIMAAPDYSRLHEVEFPRNPKPGDTVTINGRLYLAASGPLPPAPDRHFLRLGANSS